MAVEFHLRVFLDRSELHKADGSVDTFQEGQRSSAAVARYRKIVERLQQGFLDNAISNCAADPGALATLEMSEEHVSLLSKIADSVTSEVGRALLGLSILQLTIKAIEPGQSIRLHKSGAGGQSFGWVEGISMRSLDRDFITPALRAAGISRMNADGFMMTRSFAENYPYSGVYKAAIRGARGEWLELVEALESGDLQPEPGLRFLISRLLNEAEGFRALVDDAIDKLGASCARGRFASISDVQSVISKHMEESTYAARLMEIGMHALLQALDDLNLLAGLDLVPLSQMRSANKKHGNVADVELADGKFIEFAWDAKYGKAYLRDEFDELSEKIGAHAGLRLAGFVTSVPLVRREEHMRRIAELEELHQIRITCETLDEWVQARTQELAQSHSSEREIAHAWIRAYVESLGQRRAETAPIDEPCGLWVKSLMRLLD